MTIPTKGAWQCSNCGYWNYGYSDAREAPFGVCPVCVRKMSFYPDPVDNVPPVPSWSIEIKDGKIVYCGTAEIEIGTVESGKWQTVTFTRKDTRMTEKEFLDKLSTKDSPSYSYSALLALELAKQHGAKFDPEPIELPTLRKMAFGLPTKGYGIRIVNRLESNLLSSEQADEVIRRCELIPRLRKYITDRYLRLSNGQVTNITPHSIKAFDIGDLLDMINGRDVQSAEGEDHAINP